MVWGYIQYGGAREICKVDGNIDSAKYQQILASQYIPNYKRVRFFNRMELLAITQAPLWSFSGVEKIKVLQGWASTVSTYEYYWAYLGKNEGVQVETGLFIIIKQ